MRAIVYSAQGPAAAVLRLEELPDPEPGPGEVRVRVTTSGVNPGDVKKRADAFNVGMPFPLVIPHSDGAGVIDASGEGVDSRRVGTRVWLWGAQSYRAFGTAAEFACVPERQAVPLPEAVAAGAMPVRLGEPLPLERCAEAHARAEAGARERVILRVAR